MELQRFVVLRGDGIFRQGDTITFEGVFDRASMSRVERVRHRLSLVSRWFRLFPENMRWAIYLRAQRFTDWLDPDRER